MRKIIKNDFIIPTLLLALIVVPSFADETGDIEKMLRSGQTTEALQKVDNVLVVKPKDAQMRFLKGLIFAEQNKSTEAIVIFSKLSDEYPKLPEPYNNLAVLYAASGQYEKARSALEMAIHTNPAYATAHENLGDVYAKLANQAYDNVLKLDSDNPNAKLKLTLIHNLVGTSERINSKFNRHSATFLVQTEQNKSDIPIQTKIETAIKSESTTRNTKVDFGSDNINDEIIKTVENWAKAWANKDTLGYLSYYAKDFQTPKGELRKFWEEQRRNRIEGKKNISVKIEGVKVNVNDNNATVKFHQIYSSSQVASNSYKTLIMIKSDGKWQIKQELTGG